MDSARIWLGFGILGLPVAWMCVSSAPAIFTPPERSGRDLLKRKSKGYGADISRKPDAAWDEIVDRNINTAKFTASHRPDPHHRNWRANLVRQLDAEAMIVARIMQGMDHPERGAAIRETLASHGVLDP